MAKIAGSGSISRSHGLGPRIRIHTKMSWIRNTGAGNCALSHLVPLTPSVRFVVSVLRREVAKVIWGIGGWAKSTLFKMHIPKLLCVCLVHLQCLGK
jgi:hypothetical protein